MSVERVEPAVADVMTDVREDAAIAGVVTRLSGEYVLRGLRLVIEGFGDLRAALIGQTINTANVVPVMQTEAGRLAADADGILPDEARRPISIARVADTTGLPFETVRRVVQRLVNAGACVRVDGGLIVPKAFVIRPSTLAAVGVGGDYTRRLLRDLDAAGLPEAAPVEPRASDDAAAARRRGLLTTEYGLRALRLLIDTYGDIQSGIVAQTVITANTAHLDARLGDGGRYAGIDEMPPDKLRNPISVSRLAESLDLPFETVRGQVQRLIDAGVCARTDGGIIVPAAVLERPPAVNAAILNVRYIRKLARELRAVGADDAPNARDVAPKTTPTGSDPIAARSGGSSPPTPPETLGG